MFEDKGFSRIRLKSCFLRSFSSWASLVHDVEHSFVRDILCIPYLCLVVWFVFCFLCLFLFWLLAPLCMRLVYSLGPLVFYFLLNISALLIHQKKEKNQCLCAFHVPSILAAPTSPTHSLGCCPLCFLWLL